jgi:hypothetical protein
MPNLIKQGEARVITKNGEIFVNIALELNIKLDGSNIQISNDGNSNKSLLESQLKQDEKINWEIPDFESSNKIQFGK